MSEDATWYIGCCAAGEGFRWRSLYRQKSEPKDAYADEKRTAAEEAGVLLGDPGGRGLRRGGQGRGPSKGEKRLLKGQKTKEITQT